MDLPVFQLLNILGGVTKHYIMKEFSIIETTEKGTVIKRIVKIGYQQQRKEVSSDVVDLVHASEILGD